MEIAGKSAVVTGGGNGIGRAIALALAKKGANVAVADIESDTVEAVAREIAALGVKSLAAAVDVAVEDQVRRLADKAWAAFGSVELLVNNAGVMHAAKTLVDTTKEDFDWSFSVNVGGMLNGVRIFGPRFIESGSKCWIVNTGSEHSLGVPHVLGGVYTATKHAVLGLSDVLSRELPENVGVSVLCPGIVETTIWRSTERRQDAHGGAEEGDETAGQAMKFGMPAEQVAQRAIQGIEEETFYIVTHPHAVEVARERWLGAERAFAEQAPRYDGDEVYEVNSIIQKLMG
jgi:NAD(P)-dependent dehydrogenase (short-subunit alcohol dehydrogenase family)